MTWESAIPKTVPETEMALARRVKELRLLRNYKRLTLAQKAGVSPSSLKRFEITGKISLEGLLKLVHALGRLGEFDGVLKPPAAKSIKELEQQSSIHIPKRGRR